MHFFTRHKPSMPSKK